MIEALNRLWAAMLVEIHSVRRDKVTLFFVFVLPLGLVFILGLAFGSVGQSIPVGVLDESNSAASHALLDTLGQDAAVAVRPYDTRAGLTDAVVRNDVSFGVVVPQSYATELASGGDVAVTVVSAGGGSNFALVQSSVGAAVGEQVMVTTAARTAAAVTGTTEETAAEVAAAVAKSATLAGVTSETVSGHVIVSGIKRTAFTALVLFLLITGLTSAGTFTELRRNHVAQRLMAAPAPTPELEVGLVSARFVTLVVQAVYIILFTAWLFGVNWGNLWATTLVTIALAICVAGMSALAGTIYTSPEQAGAIGAPIGIAMGMLGGAMWPLEIVPYPLRVVGHLLPTAWAVDAYNDILANNAGVMDVMGQIGVILAMAAVFFVLAGMRFRRVFSV
ncbi:MAG: ABC transporter permease [Acidimicrobiia bacterium]